MVRFDIITIFPDIFSSYFNESIIRRAQEKKLIEISVHNLRDFTDDKHKTVDDKPYGGGVGMILKVDPVLKAVEAIKKQKSRPAGGHLKGKKAKTRIILFSAKGKIFTQADARRLAKYDQLILICGRYEGVDERVAEYIADEEVSVGKYVLTGGEIPAMIVVDAVSRLISGVLGKKESLEEESFAMQKVRSKKYEARNTKETFATSDFPPEARLAKGGKLQTYLEYPQYTRPENFKGWKVPDVLLSGNHNAIKVWRKKMSKSK